MPLHIGASRVDPSAAAVELTDVSFAYDVRPVLKGITMTIPRGKIVAIMGGSGCGKTTILRLIGGQLRPGSGAGARRRPCRSRISTATRSTRLRRRFGMLFQFGALFTDMSVFENVAFPMREHTELPEELIRDLVLMKLHAVGLRGAAQLMPAELSGGMARRVALARAIALDPMLVMYDEPFAGLDPISLGVVGQLIRQLNDALGDHVGRRHARRLRIAEDRRLSVFRLRGQDRRRRHAGGDPRVRAIRSCASSSMAQPDGPVPFHYPAPAYREELFADVS